MPKICVEIELDTETGEVAVGVCPPAEEAMEGAEDKSYLQPVAGVQEALSKAGELLKPSAEDDAMAQMQRGYAGPAKMGMMGGGDGMQG